ncbi:MAG TPA: SBBP repeat-containing protein [Bryobacteraceae bacterium]|nr:SBBP repeat-containing protein [Bryobacteraceae bacterium]
MSWSALLVSVPAFAASPLLTYSTYLSGTSANAIVVDSSGNAYVGVVGSVFKLNPTGSQILATYSMPGFTVNALALDSAGNLIAAGASQGAAFLTRFDPSGKPTFRVSFYSFTSATAVALDSAGNVYFTGPLRPAAGSTDIAVYKLSPSGDVIYSFIFGGSQNDTAHAIAVDASGDAYVAGETLSTDFPVTTAAAQSRYAGGASAPGYPPYGDAFLAKIDPTGSKLIYATYWGGSSADAAYSIALDALDNAYIAGATSSANFPVTSGAFQPTNAGPPADPLAPNVAGDAFVAKFSTTGASIWSTLWGGASPDAAYALALDSAGDVYFAGTSESINDRPAAGPSVATCRRAGGPFVAALDPTGSKLLHSTAMPGLGYDIGSALALDSTGAVYLAGAASSQVFFATPGAAQYAYWNGPADPYSGGATDAFAARLDFTQSAAFAACVLNAASFQAGNTASIPLGAVAPGEIVSIFGSALGPSVPQGLQLNSAGNVSTSTFGVAVAFDGVPAPLLYVSDTQINAVVPFGLANPTTQMTVAYNGQYYGPVTMPVAAGVPAIFTSTQSGTGQAAVLNQDGTLNSIANPAARGSVITFYAEGAGAMSPALADGAVPAPPNLPVPAQNVTIAIRGVNADVQYAGAAPGYVAGLLQVNAVVPDGIDFGNLVPLVLSVGSFTSQLGVTIAVK